MRVDELPDRLVIDASVGVKWVVREEGSDLAVKLIAGRHLMTSSLFWTEAANVLASKVRRQELGMASAVDAWTDLAGAPLAVFTLDRESTGRALSLAHELAHPIYDCCYLALALAENAALITADRRFFLLASRHSHLREHVLLLSDINRAQAPA